MAQIWSYQDEQAMRVPIGILVGTNTMLSQRAEEAF